jgi:hypothetical protein
MQILRVLSIMTLVVIIGATSNNIFSLKSNYKNVDTGIQSSSIIGGIFSYDNDKFVSSSSLLQTTSAQEQEEEQGAEQQREEEGEENENENPDAVDEKGEEQDEANGEREPSTEQQQQEGSSKEESLQIEEQPQEQEQIKSDCRPGEHFDSEVDLCIPDQENICDDDKDNVGDSKIGSKDSDCLPNKIEEEQLEQDNNNNLNEQDESEKSLEEEVIVPLDDEQENNLSKKPITLERQDNNTSPSNSISPGGYDLVNRGQENQNLTNSDSKGMPENNNNTNSTSLIEPLSSSAASVEEDGFILTCNPGGVTMIPGEHASLTCTLENKGNKTENMVIDCSGLQASGIGCYVDGQYLSKKSLIKQMSSINFSILLVSESAPPTPAGTYPFDISVVKCTNSTQC